MITIVILWELVKKKKDNMSQFFIFIMIIKNCLIKRYYFIKSIQNFDTQLGVKIFRLVEFLSIKIGSESQGVVI